MLERDVGVGDQRKFSVGEEERVEVTHDVLPVVLQEKMHGVQRWPLCLGGTNRKMAQKTPVVDEEKQNMPCD